DLPEGSGGGRIRGSPGFFSVPSEGRGRSGCKPQRHPNRGCRSSQGEFAEPHHRSLSTRYAGLYCPAMGALAVVGGTGPEGLGLALRLATAGEEVVVGSRAAKRAEAAAATVRAAVRGARVSGRTNRESIAAADRIVLALPFGGLPAFLEQAPDGLAGKLVVDVVVPLALRDGLFEVAPIRGAASAGELIQSRLPRARV